MSSLVFLALNASYAPFAFKNLDLNRLLLPRGIDHLILDSENIEYFLMGDLHCDTIATRYDNNTCKLMSITEPTRITPTSATLIDVIYTNCPDKVVCSGVRHILSLIHI